MTVKLNMLFSENISLNIRELTYISNYKNDISTWTNTLTELELGEAARQIFITLLELRGLNCNDLIRFEIIQQIEPHLTHLLISLEQHYLNNSLLDTKRDQQISELVLEIKSHHALLYVEMFNRTHKTIEERKFSFFEFNLRKKLNHLRKYTAILALSHLTDLLYSLQLLYLDTPKKFWQKAYYIYQSALSSNFLHDTLNKDDNHNEIIYSIENTFNKLVLLSILNSHKLRQSEVKELMQCISYWTTLIHFTSQPSNNTNYYINFNVDASPRLSLSHKDDSKDFTYIYVNDLSSYLESTLKPNAHYYSKTEEKNLTNVLKHHVINLLNLDQVRIQPRYSEQGNVDITLGMTSAHFFLSNAKHFKETLELEIDLSLQSLSQSLSHIGNDNDLQPPLRNYEHRFNAEISKVYPVRILNRSTSGYGLQWQHHVVKNLRTGEFILIKETQNSPWVGAIIRWMKNTQDHFIEFGIELFAKHMCPMAVHISQNNQTAQKSSVYHPAIVFSQSAGQYGLILPSAQIFYENQNLVLRFGAEEVKIFLKNSTILTQSCATFNFELLEQSKQPLLDQYFKQYIATLETQDLWESLK